MPATAYRPTWQWYTATSTTSANSLYLNTGWYPDNYRYQPTWATATTNATTTWANDVVWQYWVDGTAQAFASVRPLVAPAPSAADLERREQRQLASVRARALLENFLSDQQKAELEQQGYFHVVGSRGRLYRILARGQAGNVELLRPDGMLQARLCAHPRNNLPNEDAWLAQMLELRSDENHFLRVANLHVGSLPGDLYAAAA